MTADNPSETIASLIDGDDRDSEAVEAENTSPRAWGFDVEEINRSYASAIIKPARRNIADLKFLDLEGRLGRLVPVAEVGDAAAKCAEATVRLVDRLPTYADAIAAAVGKDGPSGARTKLKEIAREIRQAIADAHGELARTAEPMTLEPAAFDEIDG